LVSYIQLPGRPQLRTWHQSPAEKKALGVARLEKSRKLQAPAPPTASPAWELHGSGIAV
jgi:hypothetical protein